MKSFSVLTKQILSIPLLLVVLSCSSDKIGKYTKEELPPNFEYKIIKEESSTNLEKNQLEVEINQKLTEGQIATLAEDLYNKKDIQKRFYINYILKGSENSVAYWATSHFDPELDISIIGSTENEDNSMLKTAEDVQGNIIGIFNEEEYTFAIYTVYEDKDLTFVKTSFKNGQSMIEEVNKIDNIKGGVKLTSKDIEGNGEYYILKDNTLEFYNKENNKFTEAKKIK